MKGATNFDQLCHKVFASNGNGTNYLSRRTGVKCGYCGYELESYYCESRLYLVECHHCKTKALVMAGSPEEAAYMTFGHAVYPVDDVGEEAAVNADRIRAMTDEELANFVHEGCPYIEQECTMIGCVKCILEWLQQPVKEMR